MKHFILLLSLSSPFQNGTGSKVVPKMRTEVQLHLLPLIKIIFRQNAVSKEPLKGQCVGYYKGDKEAANYRLFSGVF